MIGKITLNKNDIETIVAKKFLTDIEQVNCYVRETTVGYGTNEHTVKEPIVEVLFKGGMGIWEE